MTTKEVNEQLSGLVETKAKAAGLTLADVDPKESLLTQGILDSISFLELILELESTFEIQIDFENLDPSEFTSLIKLEELITTQLSQQSKP